MTTAASSFAELSASLADLAAASTPSIVEVQSHHSLASGFVWRDGLVITPDETFDATGRTDAVAHAARRGIIHL